jgi:hypothetical protein
MEVATERCPWCESVISRDEFDEITARIRAEEQNRLFAAENRMRESFEADSKAIRLKATEETETQVAVIRAERDAVLQKVKEVEAREIELRKMAEEQAAKKYQSLLELNEQQKQKELAEQRTILDADRDQELLKKQAEFARERAGWQKKVMEMDHQLQRMNANQIGEGAEIDLFETLRTEFPGDSISRIKKGQPGADIHHDIFHKGEICGRIIYDSKNRQGWQYTYVTKLREDQLEAQADHAVLCTTVFPSGKKELCIESDVVVINPAQAVHVAHLLRQALVSMHVRGMSMKQRTEKTDRLYRFITSPSYFQRFGEITRLTGEMLELDVLEVRAHNATWKKRGTLLTRQNNVLREIDTEISAVIEGDGQAAESAA